jgi:hypothetical protein
LGLVQFDAGQHDLHAADHDDGVPRSLPDAAGIGDSCLVVLCNIKLRHRICGKGNWSNSQQGGGNR